MFCCFTSKSYIKPVLGREEFLTQLTTPSSNYFPEEGLFCVNFHPTSYAPGDATLVVDSVLSPNYKTILTQKAQEFVHWWIEQPADKEKAKQLVCAILNFVASETNINILCQEFGLDNESNKGQRTNFYALCALLRNESKYSCTAQVFTRSAMQILCSIYFEAEPLQRDGSGFNFKQFQNWLFSNEISDQLIPAVKEGLSNEVENNLKRYQKYCHEIFTRKIDTCFTTFIQKHRINIVECKKEFSLQMKTDIFESTELSTKEKSQFLFYAFGLWFYPAQISFKHASEDFKNWLIGHVEIPAKQAQSLVQLKPKVIKDHMQCGQESLPIATFDLYGMRMSFQEIYKTIDNVFMQVINKNFSSYLNTWQDLAENVKHEVYDMVWNDIYKIRRIKVPMTAKKNQPDSKEVTKAKKDFLPKFQQIQMQFFKQMEAEAKRAGKKLNYTPENIYTEFDGVLFFLDTNEERLKKLLSLCEKNIIVQAFKQYQEEGSEQSLWFHFNSYWDSFQTVLEDIELFSTPTMKKLLTEYANARMEHINEKLDSVQIIIQGAFESSPSKEKIQTKDESGNPVLGSDIARFFRFGDRAEGHGPLVNLMTMVNRELATEIASNGICSKVLHKWFDHMYLSPSMRYMQPSTEPNHPGDIYEEEDGSASAFNSPEVMFRFPMPPHSRLLRTTSDIWDAEKKQLLVTDWRRKKQPLADIQESFTVPTEPDDWENKFGDIIWGEVVSPAVSPRALKVKKT
ncbi:MAG: hypothetical protein V4591_06225 [Bdellovibrionota bacterium]